MKRVVLSFLFAAGAAAAPPFTPGPEYKAADLAPKWVTQPGTALDFSGKTDRAPAGTYGKAVLAGPGHMEFEKRPGVPLRFRATYHFASEWSYMREIRNQSGKELKAGIDVYVAELCRRGYNMVRTHTVEQFLMLDAPAKGRPDPRFADALDYSFAELKKNGIYLNLNIAAYQLLHPFNPSGPAQADRPHGIKPRLIFGDEAIRQDWLDTARYFLTHVNPYTGLALKDDPMLVFVEPFNELGQAMRRTPYPDEATKAFVREKFRAFLLRRDGKIDEARFPENPNEVNGGGLSREWLEFCAESLRETGAWMNARLRELGCTAPIGQYNISPARYFGDIRFEQSDFVLRNGYHCHPSNLSRPGSITRQESAVENAMLYFTNMASCRFADRPMIVTEYNHTRNRYEYEQLLFPAYAALQGFTGLTLHAVSMRPWEPEKEFSTYIDRMTELLSFCLFQRGDVSPSGNLVELAVPKLSLYGRGADAAIAAEQARWALLTRFALRYEDTARPPLVAALPPPKPAAVMPLQGYADVTGGRLFTETGATRGGTFDLAPLVADCRARGIFPPGNRTDPARGVWESDTGELLLDAPKKLFQLRTPRAEAVVGEDHWGDPLPVLMKVRSSVPAALALVSLDGQTLAKDSGRMLLFYLTENLNTGMEFSADRRELLKPGTGPSLLRTGKLELALRLPAGKSWRLYPLRSDGLRRKAIPLESSGGGHGLTLDTARLPDGPTGVFELVATEPAR